MCADVELQQINLSNLIACTLLEDWKDIRYRVRLLFLYFYISYSHYDYSVPSAVHVTLVEAALLRSCVCYLHAGFGKWVGVAVLVMCATAGE